MSNSNFSCSSPLQNVSDGAGNTYNVCPAASQYFEKSGAKCNNVPFYLCPSSMEQTLFCTESPSSVQCANSGIKFANAQQCFDALYQIPSVDNTWRSPQDGSQSCQAPLPVDDDGGFGMHSLTGVPSGLVVSPAYNR